MSEHDEQAALIHWKRLNEEYIPELRMLYAIPNGGLRNKRVARKLKAEGVEAGVWDLALDVPRGGYHGLRIEMKYGKNKLTPAQRRWGALYREYGYQTAVCYDWIEAKQAILLYLEGKRFNLTKIQI